ncbi:MAG: hypothetical protein ACKOQ6_07250 [Bacteroidota bacterium]
METNDSNASVKTYAEQLGSVKRLLWILIIGVYLCAYFLYYQYSMVRDVEKAAEEMLQEEETAAEASPSNSGNMPLPLR